MSSPTSTAGCGPRWPGAGRMPSVTRTSTVTSRGIKGRDRHRPRRPRRRRRPRGPRPAHRRRVADGARRRRRTRRRPARGGAARWRPPTQLDATVGTRLALTDLVDGDAKPLQRSSSPGPTSRPGSTRVCGSTTRWASAGVSRSDFTTYGPFVAAEGSFDRPSPGRRPRPGGGCRARPRSRTDELPAVRAGVAQVIDALRHTAGILPDGTADPDGAVGGATPARCPGQPRGCPTCSTPRPW